MNIVVPSSITTVVWDLDGTLLDSFGIHVEIIGQVFPRHGKPVPTRQKMLQNYHGRLEESIGALLNDATDAELLAIMQDFLAIDNAYIKEVNQHLFPDAVDFARRAHAKGLRQILVTNRAHGVDRGLASPRNMIEHSVLNGLIDQIVCGDEATHRKPKPEALQPFFSDGGYKPEEILVLGDQFVDALFAHNLKASGILVQRHDEVTNLEKLADGWECHVAIVSSLNDIALH